MALIFYRLEFWAALILISTLFLIIAVKLHLRWWPAWFLRVLLIVVILACVFSFRKDFIYRNLPKQEILIIDLSDSVLKSQLNNFVVLAREWQKQSTNRIIIVYGDKAYLTYPAEANWPQVDQRGNNLTDAFLLASDILGMAPGKIIVATDGKLPQSNELTQAIQKFASRNQEVDWLQLGSRDTLTDGFLGQLWAPRSIWEGKPFYAVLPVFSNTPINAIKFQVIVNGAILQTEPIIKDTYVEFLIPPQAAGITTIQVHADIPSDQFLENNNSYISVEVNQQPRVLFVTKEINSPEVQGLLDDISLNGIVIDEITPAQLPKTMNEIGIYKVIFLNNFLASDITQEQMVTLQSFVSISGGGLIFIGGRNSYTLGGYKNTVLEAMLPVKLEPPDRTKRPPIVFLLVLDRSASMGTASQGSQLPIDLAREAAMRALEKLQVGDYVGVITFQSGYTWDVPLEKIETNLQLREALDAVSRIVAFDGTKMYEALDDAILKISNLPDSAPLTKNILLLSDGASSDGDLYQFTDLAKAANQNNINISTIALGEEANEQTMQAIAQSANGRYYRVLNTVDLPKIMIQESDAIRAENIQQGETNLVRSTDDPQHPILSGLSLKDLPLLDNYNALSSKSKEGAEDVLLSANFNDPILSVWQYGLGRVVAWMSDAGSDWSEKWSSPTSRGTFWSQVVQYALPNPNIKDENVDITLSDADLKIEATIINESSTDEERNLNFSEVKFSYSDSSSEIHTFLLPQIAPGLYQAEIPRPSPGAYRAMLEYTLLNGEKQTTPVLFDINTPNEWLPTWPSETDIVNMESLISNTSGNKIEVSTLISLDEEISNESNQPKVSKIDWGWYLLLSLIILWPIEILLRRRWLPWM